jgi:hypothetical protein
MGVPRKSNEPVGFRLAFDQLRGPMKSGHIVSMLRALKLRIPDCAFAWLGLNPRILHVFLQGPCRDLGLGGGETMRFMTSED